MGLRERFEEVTARVNRALQGAGRAPDSARIVAVSKRHPAEAVRELVAEGHFLFGESRVQEALTKIPLCPGRAEWHFIGHLQKNKVRKALPHFSLFHGIDSLELAEDVNRIAEEEGLRAAVLLEVNTSAEASKFGFSPDGVIAQMSDLLELPRLEIRGLMTMAPIVPKPELARPHFARLRELRDRIEEQFGVKLPELSMGMSGDFEAALAEGATLVRIGTALFGEHPVA
jgi:pyridoxal phosphate enzyme (YggS family)